MTLFEIATDKRFPMDTRQKVLYIITMFGKRAGVDDLTQMLSVPFQTLNFTGMFLVQIRNLKPRKKVERTDQSGVNSNKGGISKSFGSTPSIIT